MSPSFADELHRIRRDAANEAEAVLASRGFERQADGSWHGALVGKAGDIAYVSVKLPPRFPDVLPDVFAGPPAIERKLAHVQAGGKMCLAPNTGVLLDATRPGDIVQEALDRAEAVLLLTGPDRNRADLIREFSAYWTEPGSGAFYSICTPDQETGVIALARASLGSASQVVADDQRDMRRWANAVGAELSDTDEAFFIACEEAFEPPGPQEWTTLRGLLALVRSYGSSGSLPALRRWLSARRRPSLAVVSMPLPGGSENVLVAAFARPSPVAPRKRRGKRAVLPALDDRITRVGVRRMDPGFLLRRGGGDPRLLDASVAVVGCGAVGSMLAQSLAATGIGRLRLIDNEDLSSENIHRHALGAAHVGMNKARALAATIRQRLPHIAVEPYDREVLELLSDPAEVLLGNDLVALALGDETLELRINALLRASVPRMHVWLEPLGLGGHLLTTGLKSGRGCFRCLFERDNGVGLHNKASLAAPGQDFGRTQAGCAGVFTPFGFLDAQMAATQAAREAADILLRPTPRAALVSWVVSAERFLDGGYKLSLTGSRIPPGSTRRVEDYGRRDCPDCAGDVK